MPLWYRSITVEHLAVRNSCGIFDISHMGRLVVRGRRALDLINNIIPSDLSRLDIGKGLYSTFCNERGGILDDVVIFLIKEETYLIVVNASNLSKDLSFIESKNSPPQASIDDLTGRTAMVALQGPDAGELLETFSGVSLTDLKRFGIYSRTISGVDALVSRTGYTGEDGFEIIFLDISRIVEIWEAMIRHGGRYGLLPCGLGARDTLRLEAGLCLYGQDLNEDITPIEGSLNWIVSKDKAHFEGSERILEQMSSGTERVRIGIKMEEGGIPREGSEIRQQSTIGRVTSGTFSPVLKRGIAMGYVKADHGVEGEEIRVKIRGDERRAVVKRPPFYDERLYGWKRERRKT